jgi:hypothetical protein
MASYHHKPFADFAITGKGSRHGALSMRGNSVFSYDMEIAYLNRHTRHILLCDTKVSRTTTMHQGAVSLGFKLHLASLGWTMGTVHSLTDA